MHCCYLLRVSARLPQCRSMPAGRDKQISCAHRSNQNRRHSVEARHARLQRPAAVHGSACRRTAHLHVWCRLRRHTCSAQLLSQSGDSAAAGDRCSCSVSAGGKSLPPDHLPQALSSAAWKRCCLAGCLLQVRCSLYSRIGLRRVGVELTCAARGQPAACLPGSTPGLLSLPC